MRGCYLLAVLLLGACASADDRPDGRTAAGIAAARSFAGTGFPEARASGGASKRQRWVEATAARIRHAASAFCATGAAPDGRRKAPLLRPGGDCDFSVTVTESGDINAFSDGHRVRVTSGLVNFAVDEAELAFAIAHEMAHNLIHVGPGALDGPRRQQEYQADHMGLYLVARAGYSPDRAIRLLARLASRDTGRLHPDYPPFNARHRKLPEIVARIERKRAMGLPLLPEHLVSDLVARRAE